MASVEINFENENPIFPGENVKGKIEINLKKNIKIKKLILAIRGRAKCNWEEDTFKGQLCSKEVTFFNSIVPLIPEKMVLPDGNHEYEFEFVLPQNCPASSKEKIFTTGYEIKYEAVVYFVRPYKFDLKFDKELKVVYGFDLNLFPKFQALIYHEDEESITAIAGMGYVAGEEIPVDVLIKKTSNNKITRIVCYLNKIVSHDFLSKSGKLCSTTYDIRLSEKVVEFSPGKGEYTFYLDIPGEKSSPSNPNMKLINIQYSLIVKLQQTFSKNPMKFMIEDVSVMEFPIDWRYPTTTNQQVPSSIYVPLQG